MNRANFVHIGERELNVHVQKMTEIKKKSLSKNFSAFGPPTSMSSLTYQRTRRKMVGKRIFKFIPPRISKTPIAT